MARWIRNGDEWGRRDPLPALPARGRETEPRGNRDPLPTLTLPRAPKHVERRPYLNKLLPARGRESGWRVLLIGALAVIMSACGSSQPAGTVTFQVISDTGPLAHGDAIFAATSLGGVEAEVTASPLNQTLEGYQWKVRMIPPMSAYVALIIGPQSKGAAGAFACVDTTLTSASVSGGILTFVETTRVLGPSAPCRTARP